MDTSNYIVIFAGLTFIVGSIFQLLRRYFFLKRCCTTQVGGNILDMECNEDRRDDNSKKTSYSIRYRYLADGVEYEKKRGVSKRQFKAIGEHDELTVFFDPSKPKRHYVLEIRFRIILRLILIVIVAILLHSYYYWAQG